MLSKQSQYALQALTYLNKSKELLDVKKIAKEQKIPLAFLAGIMQILARKNIVSSKKGKNGGFYLSKMQKEISLMEVINVFDDKSKFSACGMGFEKCSEKNPCPLHHFYKDIREKFRQKLLTKKIKDLK